MTTISNRLLTQTDCIPPDDDLRMLFEQFGLVSRSHLMTQVLRHSWKAARVSDVALLIDGETGTGKQVLAQAIHGLDGKRSSHPFVTVHCGTVQESLAEANCSDTAAAHFPGRLGTGKAFSIVRIRAHCFSTT